MTISSLVVYALSSPPSLSSLSLMEAELRREVPLKSICSVRWASPPRASGSTEVPQRMLSAQYATWELLCFRAKRKPFEKVLISLLSFFAITAAKIGKRFE